MWCVSNRPADDSDTKVWGDVSVLGRTIEESLLKPSQPGNHLCQDFWPLWVALKIALKIVFE